MAAETPTALQGFIVPHRSVTSARLDSTSTYTQAGPQAGVPVPQQDTDLVLSATGTQTAGTTLEVVAHTPTTFRWKRSTDSATEWRGWDAPVSIAAHQCVERSGGTSVEGLRHPHAVTLASGRVLVACCRNNTTISQVLLRSRTTTGTFGSVTIHEEDASSTYETYPALVVLPSGRVICYSVTYASSRWQIRADFSDDDGATWATYSERCLSSSVAVGTTYPLQLRATYAPGGIALVMVRSGGDASQYVSVDGGASFVLVGSYSSASLDVVSIDVARTASGMVIAMAVEWPSETRLDVFAFPLAAASDSVFLPFGTLAYSSATSTTTDPLYAPWVLYHNIATTPMTASIALAVHEDGIGVALYCVLQPPTAAFWPYCSSVGSSDEGATWRRLGQTDIQEVDRLVASTDGFWYDTTSADSAYPWNICATWQRGRAVVYHNANQRSALPTDGNSLWEAALGGYSTHTLPAVGGADSPRNSMAFTHSWLPIETPANNGFTGSGTASADEFDATVQAWEISTANPNTRVYTASATLTNAVGVVVRGTIRTDAGSARLGVVIDDGGTDYQVEIGLATGSVSVIDVVAGGALATQSTSSATWYEVILWVRSGKASAWFRAVDGGDDREWTEVGDNLSLTSTTGLTDGVYFGARVGGANTTYWREVQYGTTFAEDYADGFANPADLRGRSFSARPLYIGEGVSIAATHGPAAMGDEWEITTRYRYGVEHLHPRESRSPLQTWRSVGTTVAESFVWNIDDFDGGPSYPLWGLYLDRINFCTIDITTAQDAALTWGTPVDIDLRTVLSFERKGSKVRPRASSSTVAGPYIHRNEAAGGWFQFPNGDIRRILGNDEGWLTSGSTIAERRAVLHLEGTDNGEDANGTGYVWWPRAAVYLHHLTSGADVSAIRLRIRPSGSIPAPPLGYYEAGISVLGSVAVLGRSFDFGHRNSMLSNVEVTEIPGGSRHVRTAGKRGRAWNLRLDEGQITHQTRGTTQGDYVLGTSTSGARPVAGARDTAWLLEGLHEELGGPATPVVWAPYIPAGEPNTVIHTWQRVRGAGYVEIGPNITIENRRGADQIGEIVATGITLEEIL